MDPADRSAQQLREANKRTIRRKQCRKQNRYQPLQLFTSGQLARQVAADIPQPPAAQRRVHAVANAPRISVASSSAAPVVPTDTRDVVEPSTPSDRPLLSAAPTPASASSPHRREVRFAAVDRRPPLHRRTVVAEAREPPIAPATGIAPGEPLPDPAPAPPASARRSAVSAGLDAYDLDRRVRIRTEEIVLGLRDSWAARLAGAQAQVGHRDFLIEDLLRQLQQYRAAASAPTPDASVLEALSSRLDALTAEVASLRAAHPEPASPASAPVPAPTTAAVDAAPCAAAPAPASVAVAPEPTPAAQVPAPAPAVPAVNVEHAAPVSPRIDPDSAPAPPFASALDALASQEQTIVQLRFRLREVVGAERQQSFDRVASYLHNPSNVFATPPAAQQPSVAPAWPAVPAAPTTTLPGPPPWAVVGRPERSPSSDRRR